MANKIKRVNLHINLDEPYQAELAKLLSLSGRKQSQLLGILAHEFLKKANSQLSEKVVKDYICHYDTFEALSLNKNVPGMDADVSAEKEIPKAKKTVKAEPKIEEELFDDYEEQPSLSDATKKAMGQFMI